MRILVVIETSREYNRALLRGITRFSNKIGTWTFYFPPPFWENTQKFNLRQYIKEKQIDAIIALEQTKLRGILETGLPMVISPYTRETIPNAINLVTDHRAVGEMGANHLLQHGFKHFAYCGYPRQFWSQQRQEGFQQKLKTLGHEAFIYPHTKPESSLKDLSNWIKQLPPHLGVMACVDERGRDIVEACTLAHIKVPESVGIVAVDNDAMICDLAAVPLSSIGNNAEESGYKAARLLDSYLTQNTPIKDTPKVVISPTTCIGRQSTDLAYSQDTVIANAIMFIQDNWSESIQVDTVSNAIGVSRRVLERKFQQRLNRTVLSEIKRVKILHFENLLAQTQLSVAEIAEKIGLESIEHAARYFKAINGQSPKDYRKTLCPKRGL